MPSSVIVVMVYDPAGQVLEIVYRGGRGTYRYYGVPAAEWTAFRNAPSKGTYLNETFKDKEYRFERVLAGEVPRMPRGSLRWPETGEERDASQVDVKIHR